MRRMWPALVTVTGVAAVVTSGFILSQTLPSRQVCPAAVTAASAHVSQPGPGGSLPARLRKPGRQGSALADPPLPAAFRTAATAAAFLLAAAADAYRTADDVTGQLGEPMVVIARVAAQYDKCLVGGHPEPLGQDFRWPAR
jgi:hypothetical protein